MRLPDPELLNRVPSPRHVTARHGSETAIVEVSLMNITPILGGGVHARELDHTVDRVRVPSIRGQLRMWWRALYGHEPGFGDREGAIWGGTGHGTGRRSAVELAVTLNAGDWTTHDVDADPVHPNSPSGYALFAARRTEQHDTASRWRRGRKFSVRLTFPSSSSLEAELRNTVRAWILFGGYGARTRRGVGSLAVTDAGQRATWLPSSGTREALSHVFEQDVLMAPGVSASDTPLLRGAHLVAGRAVADPADAWYTAVAWLRDFRQGTPPSSAAPPDDFARRYGPNRPGRSNWPEADKVRHNQAPPRGATWVHVPRHNADPAWPRAGLGLPIVGQFGGDEATPARRDRIPFELVWNDGKERNRLASPLIIKAMALADGRFVPIALWLLRADPSGQVHLRGDPATAAPFGKLTGAGETAHFAPLRHGGNLRDIFLGWVCGSGRPGAPARIAP